MGQLHEGKKALGFFEKGLEIMKAERQQVFPFSSVSSVSLGL